MKDSSKITCLAVLLAASISAQATEIGNQEISNTFYLKGSVAVNKMNTAKQTFDTLSLKSKSKISPSFAIGFGRYITDTIRADLIFDYSNVRFKNVGGSRLTQVDDEDEGLVNVSYKVNLKRKASIYAALANGYVDLPITEDVKFFVGGGIGLATIKEQGNVNYSGTVVSAADGGILGSKTDSDSGKSKKKVNFAYALTVGSSFDITKKLHLEVAYSWKDFGKTKYDSDDHVTANHYRGHNIGLGVRFDI